MVIDILNKIPYLSIPRDIYNYSKPNFLKFLYDEMSIVRKNSALIDYRTVQKYILNDREVFNSLKSNTEQVKSQLTLIRNELTRSGKSLEDLIKNNPSLITNLMDQSKKISNDYKKHKGQIITTTTDFDLYFYNSDKPIVINNEIFLMLNYSNYETLITTFYYFIMYLQIKHDFSCKFISISCVTTDNIEPEPNSAFPFHTQVLSKTKTNKSGTLSEDNIVSALGLALLKAEKRRIYNLNSVNHVNVNSIIVRIIF